MSRQQIGWLLFGLLIAVEVWSGIMLAMSAITHQWSLAVLYTLLAAINGGNASYLRRALKRG